MRSTRREQGITLIEIVLSIAVLSVFLLSASWFVSRTTLRAGSHDIDLIISVLSRARLLALHGACVDPCDGASAVSVNVTDDMFVLFYGDTFTLRNMLHDENYERSARELHMVGSTSVITFTAGGYPRAPVIFPFLDGALQRVVMVNAEGGITTQTTYE